MKDFWSQCGITLEFVLVTSRNWCFKHGEVCWEEGPDWLKFMYIYTAIIWCGGGRSILKYRTYVVTNAFFTQKTRTPPLL